MKKTTKESRDAYLRAQLDYEISKYGNSPRAEKIRIALKKLNEGA